jgi:hypothetical protein
MAPVLLSPHIRLTLAHLGKADRRIGWLLIIVMPPKIQRELCLNYSRAGVKLLDKRMKFLGKFFYNIINIDIALIWLVLT